MSSSVLFIDGSNLYGGFTEILEPGSYLNFSEFLDAIKQDFIVDRVMFYGAYMSSSEAITKADELTAKAQVDFFNEVRAHPRVEFKKGHFSKSSNKEKTVDAQFITDLVTFSLKDMLDEAIIMTGDADMTYPVQKVRELTNKKVHLAAFASRFPYGISFHTHKRIVYDYNTHFVQNVLPQYTRAPKNINVRDITHSVTRRTCVTKVRMVMPQITK